MQDNQKILPSNLNTDLGYEHLSGDESPFIKGLGIDLNQNPENGNGTNNPTQEGQNVLKLTPTRSNVKIPNVYNPEGYNKNIGSFESITTNEMYSFDYNDLFKHHISVYNGDTGVWSLILVDRELNFTPYQENGISEHRVRLRVRYDENKNIVEKHLTWTDGNNWQGWINVIAAIRTNGFDAALFPYWSLRPPHFDRRELFEWAVRPPMLKPKITKIPNTTADKDKLNKILDIAFQFCYQFIYTDGRQTTTSPYSLPSIIKTTDFLSNPDLLPKKNLLELYAGSPMVEKINLYYRFTTYRKNEAGTDLLTYGNWLLYDTINKYTDCGVNDKSVIGNDYWLRQNAWEGFSYDNIKNSIKYVFDNSKLGQIVGQELFERYQDMPSRSVALSDLGDSLMLCNNEYGFNNFSCAITNNISTSIAYTGNYNCVGLIRTIKLYFYAGRERGNDNSETSPFVRGVWHSQVGYFLGDDTQMRWGGQYVNNSGLQIDEAEGKYFDLNFADKDSLRVYLKGTQYYADAEWYVCRQDFTLQKIDHLLDRNNQNDLTFIGNVLSQLGFFVGVFTLKVPAGRYVATLGRHNVLNSDNYRDTSTYIMGIANSRLASIVTYKPDQVSGHVSQNTVKTDAIVSNSKEIEIDCTTRDVDLWGRGSAGDLFYVFTPFKGPGNDGTSGDRNRWQFAEGYLYESQRNRIPIEKFPYGFQRTGGERGVLTDKNGFYFANTWGKDSDQADQDIVFSIEKDCNYPFNFTIIVADGAYWKKIADTYFITYNGGNVGAANRIIYKGRVTDLTGLIGYSNIGVSIVDGATDYTDNNGEFTLIIHNGLNTPRTSNVYINAGGNFIITVANCGFVPLTQYNENNPLISPSCNVARITNQDRLYPELNQRVVVQTNEQTSLKSNGDYVVTVVGADLAGRVTYAQKLNELVVASFNGRLPLGNLFASTINWNLLGQLRLPNDIKWLAFSVSLANNYKKYIQWVGDYIKFVDSAGNETTDPNTATLVKIGIKSLLNANIQKNFSLLSTYQFSNNDRLRIYDNGEGVLFDTATYGGVIDVEVQGTNYNQAAVNANLIPPATNTVLNSASTSGIDPTVIYVVYDSRFDKLKDKAGFWIELYTPAENNDKLPFFEASDYFPIINNEIAEYTGGGVTAPQYNYPVTGTLEYWDTYLLNRSIAIPGIGNRFIQHPFESPNVTDTWGYKLASGGRPNTISPYAAKMWYIDSVIRSDDFVSEGLINGLGTFREENKKSFKGYQRGGIVFVICQFSELFFGCENDFFVTDFNYNFIFANSQGVQVANLTNNLGEPHQKIGSNYGCSYQDTRTVITFDKFVFWYDRKNESYIVSDYRSATDTTDLTDKDGRKYGIKSYIVKKTQFINEWNNDHTIDRQFDVIAGIDIIRKNIFLTFRPRRTNSNNLDTYVNNIRNILLKANETVVYNIERRRWIKFEGFTPEGYGKVRGSSSGVEMITFAASQQYLHNNTIPGSSLNFYGIQTEPVIIGVINKKVGDIKILQSLSQDGNGEIMYVDMIYSSQQNTFTYIPLNQWKEREKTAYGAVQRDMVTYFSPFDVKKFRSTLIDGKRLFGEAFVIRFVGNYNKLDKYFDIILIDSLFAVSVPTLKP